MAGSLAFWAGLGIVKAQTVPAGTIQGNNTPSTGPVQPLSATQVQTLLGVNPTVVTNGFSVLSYGAVCDGSTDDGNAINAAVAAAGSNATVFLPPGRTCAIASTITLSSNQMIFAGNGGTLKKLGSINGLVVSGNQDKVQDLFINGNSQGGSGMGITGNHDYAVHLVSFANQSHGIYLDGESSSCNDNTVTQSEFFNNQGIGISQNECTEEIISDNSTHDNQFEGITVDNNSNRNMIRGNSVNHNCLSGGVGGIGIDHSSYTTISGNIVERTNGQFGISFQNNLGTSIYNTLTGNTFNMNGSGGVHLKTNGSAYTLNTIVSANTFDSAGYYAVLVDSASNSNIITSNSLGGGSIVNSGAYTIVTLNQ